LKTRLRFEKLEIWQNARALNQSVSRTIRTFPAEEHFALTSQIRRASISISSNIAEGAGRNSDKDFAHFLEQAYGSCMELASQLFLALMKGMLARTSSQICLTPYKANPRPSHRLIVRFQ
jgi:four helix bundle protein